jgi:hypothetical protein
MEDGFTVSNVRDVAKFERGDLFHSGGLEYWSGVLEYWKIGMVEY